MLVKIQEEPIFNVFYWENFSSSYLELVSVSTQETELLNYADKTMALGCNFGDAFSFCFHYKWCQVHGQVKLQHLKLKGYDS